MKKQKIQKSKKCLLIYLIFISITILSMSLSFANAATNEKYYFVHSLKSEYNMIDFSSDGRYMLAASNDRVFFIDIQSNKILWNYDKEYLERVAISPDGNFIALRSKNSVDVLDHSKKVLWTYDVPSISSRMNALYITLNGNYLATTCFENKICFFDKKGTLLWKFDTENPVKRIVISSDGEYTIAVSETPPPTKSNIYFLNKNGNLLWEKNSTTKVNKNVAMTPNGDFMVASFYPGTGLTCYGDCPSDINASYITGVSFIDNTGKIIDEVSHLKDQSRGLGPVDRVAISSDGTNIVFGDQACWFKWGKCNLWIIDRNKNSLFNYTLDEIITGIRVTVNGHVIVTSIPGESEEKQTIHEFAPINKKSIGLNPYLLNPSGKTSEGAPILIEPLSNYELNYSNPTFKWSNLNAKKYILKIDGKEYETTNTEFSLKEPLNVGVHNWTVKAVYQDDTESPFSKQVTFATTSTIVREVESPVRTELIAGVILVSLAITGIVVRPYYKRAKLKREMAKTPTDWCPHCKKFTGGAKVCPHCGKQTTAEVTYAGKKGKKK